MSGFPSGLSGTRQALRSQCCLHARCIKPVIQIARLWETAFLFLIVPGTVSHKTDSECYNKNKYSKALFQKANCRKTESRINKSIFRTAFKKLISCAPQIHFPGLLNTGSVELTFQHRLSLKRTMKGIITFLHFSVTEIPHPCPEGFPPRFCFTRQ